MSVTQGHMPLLVEKKVVPFLGGRRGDICLHVRKHMSRKMENRRCWRKLLASHVSVEKRRKIFDEGGWREEGEEVESGEWREAHVKVSPWKRLNGSKGSAPPTRKPQYQKSGSERNQDAASVMRSSLTDGEFIQARWRGGVGGGRSCWRRSRNPSRGGIRYRLLAAKRWKLRRESKICINQPRRARRI